MPVTNKSPTTDEKSICYQILSLRCNYKIPNIDKPVQPGLRLVLSTNCDEDIILEKIKKWGGSLLESEIFDGKQIHTIVSSNGVKGIIQHVMIIIEQNSPESTNKTKVVIEAALKTIDEDDPSEQITGSPNYENLRPLSIINELLDDGDWFRNGNKITNRPNVITFDNVNEDVNKIKQSSETLPQVIIGWGGRGDLPSVDQNDLAVILSGLANVHVPSSGGTLELINEKLGNLGISSGGVRLFLNHPIRNPRQPLYNDERVRGKNGRPFVLDIFLRLSKQTLIGSELEILSTNIDEQKRKFERESIDEFERMSSHLEAVIEINEELEEENKTYKRVNEELRNKNLDLQADLEHLEINLKTQIEENQQLEKEKQTEIDRRKLRASQDKEKIKDLKKEKNQYIELAEDYENYEQLKEKWKRFAPFREIIHDFYIKNDCDDEEEFLGLFSDSLMPNEANEYDSISSVLNYVHHNMGDSFIIMSSAFSSGKKHKNFKFARRVMEAFEMMKDCLPEIRSLAGNKKIDYERIFRKKSGDFAVANKETSATMQQFGKDREFNYNGEKIIMQPHIKLGTGSDDEVARIHFKYVKKYQRYVIGHCGLHLPTHSGR